MEMRNRANTSAHVSYQAQRRPSPLSQTPDSSTSVSMDRVLKSCFTVNTFCLVADLQAGATIIGCIDLIVGGMMVVVDINALEQYADVEMSSGNFMMVHCAIGSIALNLIVATAKIFLSIVLMVGISKNVHTLILLWLIASTLFSLALAVSVITSLAVKGVDTYSGLLILLSQIYFSVVVNSYYVDVTFPKNYEESSYYI